MKDLFIMQLEWLIFSYKNIPLLIHIHTHKSFPVTLCFYPAPAINRLTTSTNYQPPTAAHFASVLIFNNKTFSNTIQCWSRNPNPIFALHESHRFVSCRPRRRPMVVSMMRLFPLLVKKGRRFKVDKRAFLMIGWDSHVLDKKSDTTEMSRSMTKKEITTNRRSKKNVNEEHGGVLVKTYTFLDNVRFFASIDQWKILKRPHPFV